MKCEKYEANEFNHYYYLIIKDWIQRVMMEYLQNDSYLSE